MSEINDSVISGTYALSRTFADEVFLLVRSSSKRGFQWVTNRRIARPFLPSSREVQQVLAQAHRENWVALPTHLYDAEYDSVLDRVNLKGESIELLFGEPRLFH